MKPTSTNSVHKLGATVVSALLFIIPSWAAAFGPQSSHKAAEWGFDFVEEFDGLQDWEQSGCREGGRRCGNRYDVDHPEDMPKLLDGTKSAWGYFSMWNETVAPAPWIGSETKSGRRIWRGTKSATIDMGETNYGPSRLGIYFGDKAYKDFSVFYMVWIPKNEWPTSRGSDNVGVYTEGQPYMWTASWKFNNFEMDCGSAMCRGGNPYGEGYITTLIQQNNYAPKGMLINVDPSTLSSSRAMDGIVLNNLIGDWFGVEYRITNNRDDSQATMQIWIYDNKGNASKVMNGLTFNLSAPTSTKRWDRFMFGGNNSGVYLWGPTMQSQYYVDDLIIDAGSKGQIGPRYFSKIGAAQLAPPSPPGGGSATQTSNQ